jgi:hypothetical protein
MNRAWYALPVVILSLFTVSVSGTVRAGGQCYGGAATAAPASQYATLPSYTVPQTYYAVPQSHYVVPPRQVYYAVPQIHPAQGQVYYTPQYGTNAQAPELSRLQQLLPLLIKVAELRAQVRSQMQQAPPATQQYGTQPSCTNRAPTPGCGTFPRSEGDRGLSLPRSKKAPQPSTPPEAEARVFQLAREPLA